MIATTSICCCSVAKSHQTLCNPTECSIPGTRHPCSPSPGACSNSCPLSQWCYPTISSSVASSSSCLQSFPASGSFPVSQLFKSGGQSIGASASVSVLPKNIQGWFPLGLVWPLCCSWDSQESSPALQFKSISSSSLSLLYGPNFTSKQVCL